MSIELDLQLAVEDEKGLPSFEDVHLWLSSAVAKFQPQAEVTVRIVDEHESHQLNHDYRGKDKPTMCCLFLSKHLRVLKWICWVI